MTSISNIWKKRPTFCKIWIFSLTWICGSRQRDITSSGWKFRLNNLAVKGLRDIHHFDLSNECLKTIFYFSQNAHPMLSQKRTGMSLFFQTATHHFLWGKSWMAGRVVIYTDRPIGDVRRWRSKRPFWANINFLPYFVIKKQDLEYNNNSSPILFFIT